MLGYTARELYTHVRGEILTDTTAARVRLYDAEGTIVYDTDVLRLGELVPAENPNVAQAMNGGTHMLVVSESFTWSTIGSHGVETRMLQVYAPLLLSDRVGAQGVVEVDYFMDALESAAKGAWPTVQLVIGILLLLCLAMTILSLRSGVATEVVGDGELDADAEPDADTEPVDAAVAETVSPTPTPKPEPVVAPVVDAVTVAASEPQAPVEDPRVNELSAKMAALEAALLRSEETTTELETVRAHETALEERLEQLERELHAPAPVAVEPEPEPAPEPAPEPEPSPAPEPAAQAAAPVANGSAEPEPGGLSDDEVNDLRARLAKAAARKKHGPS